ncbi:MAG: nuclear transport factor 2 family protein [Ruminococcus sp.]|nr:nuclear transport factor 2 family protein [Ruminococcus sp.]
MNDQQLIESLYGEFYTALIDKDNTTLERVMDEHFVLTHMTGQRQSRQDFISAVIDGNLSFFAAVHEDINLRVIGDSAWLIGKSSVDAALFNSSRRSWNLQMKLCLKNIGGQWRFTEGRVSTFS